MTEAMNQDRLEEIRRRWLDVDTSAHDGRLESLDSWLRTIGRTYRHYRSDVDELLTEVERLREALKFCEQARVAASHVNEDALRSATAAGARCEELEAEVERLRGALNEMHDYAQRVAAVVCSPYPHTTVTLARWLIAQCNAALGEEA
ncbi:MAG: hypothetical protein PHQ60_16385 [Sideroxydans sp.]|nr:hypothetical protein [Sideroxydans sp.]